MHRNVVVSNVFIVNAVLISKACGLEMVRRSHFKATCFRFDQLIKDLARKDDFKWALPPLQIHRVFDKMNALL